jgi:membrane protein required for beta-lactamase induction
VQTEARNVTGIRIKCWGESFVTTPFVIIIIITSIMGIIIWIIRIVFRVIIVMIWSRIIRWGAGIRRRETEATRKREKEKDHGKRKRHFPGTPSSQRLFESLHEKTFLGEWIN